jgi:DNA-binding transcriptional LysR family regulator
MSRPDEMAAFVRILDKGGFAPAARDLGLTPSALSKLVARLEARLGVRLLARTTRRLSPTPEGEAYGARARDILALIEAAEADAAAGRARPRGHLRVNTGTAFAKHRLVPALPDFFARYPEVTLDLCVTDRRVDLVAEQADVLLRVGPLDDSSLVARKARGRAAGDLRRAGLPRAPRRAAPAGGPAGPRLPGAARARAPHRLAVPRGGSGAAGIRTLAVRGRATTDSAEALRDMALAGLGVVRVTEFLVAGDLAAGRLVPLLGAEHVSEEVPVWAVMAPGRQRMPRVQAFVDFVAERAGAG